MKSINELLVWNQSLDLVSQVYACSEQFPRSELFGLTSQLRRSAVSILSNIAEGQGRGSLREWRQFLFNARGSLYELQTQIEIARRLSFASPEMLENLKLQSEHVGRVLSGLISYVERRVDKDQPRNKKI